MIKIDTSRADYLKAIYRTGDGRGQGDTYETQTLGDIFG